MRSEITRRTLIGAASALMLAVGHPAAANTLEQQMETFLRSQVSGEAVEIDVPRLPITHQERSVLEADFSVAPRQRMSGRVPVRVALLREGTPVRSMVVGVDILATRNVLVATRPIRAGESFDPASVAFEARGDRPLPRDLVAGVDSLVGQRARRAISAGTVLRSSRFERATHVRRGERVKLVFRTGGLRIASAGRAREETLGCGNGG